MSREPRERSRSRSVPRKWYETRRKPLGAAGARIAAQGRAGQGRRTSRVTSKRGIDKSRAPRTHARTAHGILEVRRWCRKTVNEGIYSTRRTNRHAASGEGEGEREGGRIQSENHNHRRNHKQCGAVGPRRREGGVSHAGARACAFGSSSTLLAPPGPSQASTPRARHTMRSLL